MSTRVSSPPFIVIDSSPPPPSAKPAPSSPLLSSHRGSDSKDDQGGREGGRRRGTSLTVPAPDGPLKRTGSQIMRDKKQDELAEELMLGQPLPLRVSLDMRMSQLDNASEIQDAAAIAMARRAAKGKEKEPLGEDEVDDGKGKGKELLKDGDGDKTKETDKLLAKGEGKDKIENGNPKKAAPSPPKGPLQAPAKLAEKEKDKDKEKEKGKEKSDGGAKWREKQEKRKKKEKEKSIKEWEDAAVSKSGGSGEAGKAKEAQEGKGKAKGKGKGKGKGKEVVKDGEESSENLEEESGLVDEEDDADSDVDEIGDQMARAFYKQGCFIMLLPDETLLKIMAYLDETSLVRIGATCTLFKALCRERRVWAHCKMKMAFYRHYQPRLSVGLKELEERLEKGMDTVMNSDGKLALKQSRSVESWRMKSREEEEEDRILAGLLETEEVKPEPELRNDEVLSFLLQDGFCLLKLDQAELKIIRELHAALNWYNEKVRDEKRHQWKFNTTTMNAGYGRTRFLECIQNRPLSTIYGDIFPFPNPKAEHRQAANEYWKLMQRICRALFFNVCSSLGVPFSILEPMLNDTASDLSMQDATPLMQMFFFPKSKAYKMKSNPVQDPGLFTLVHCVNPEEWCGLGMMTINEPTEGYMGEPSQDYVPISPIIHEDELVIFPGAALRGLCWAFKLQMNEIRLSHYCAVRNWNDAIKATCTYLHYSHRIFEEEAVLALEDAFSKVPPGALSPGVESHIIAQYVLSASNYVPEALTEYLEPTRSMKRARRRKRIAKTGGKACLTTAAVGIGLATVPLWLPPVAAVGAGYAIIAGIVSAR